MEEWSSPQTPFAKKNYKRDKPETFDDELEELANNCTKMKKSDMNKVLTINELSKPAQSRTYKTRSKSKTAMAD